METRSTDGKVFTITHQDNSIGQICYKNYFYVRAEIIIRESNKYEIKPKGEFGTSLSVIDMANKNEVALLAMT